MISREDEEQTILERSMQAKQDSIPERERCEQCDGKGMVPMKRSNTGTTYAPCEECKSTGACNCQHRSNL